MPSSSRSARAFDDGPRARELLALALFAAALLAWWAWRGIERHVPDPVVDRVDCVSYAPFHQPGETPFEPSNRVTRERIRADLVRLSTITGCVRTYSIDQGLDQVPSVANELGLQVLLGVWIGRDRERNEVELKRALALAKSHADTIRALVVGNEVLLRGELAESELVALAARAKHELDVPVTYADVWEFWLRHPRLADAVDFVTVHVLPYWEDEPVAVDDAVEHVFSVYRRVQQVFPAHEILIGETGWPRAGRQRRAAVPGRVEQARFVRGFVDAAAERGLRYNLIEAFDQPWKRRLEGAMGGYWGLFTSDGERAFPWRGPVNADPRWREGLLGAAAGAAAFALVAGATLRRRRRRSAETGARFVLAQALAGCAAGALLVEQWRHAVHWNQGWTHDLPAIAGALATIGYAWLATSRLSRARGADGGHSVPGVYALACGRKAAAATRLLRASSYRTAFALGALRFGWLFAAAMSVVLLVFDARYRGFPWASFAMPLAMQALLALRGERLPPDAREERALVVVVFVGAALAIAQETLIDAQAVVFLGGLALFALACAGLPGSRTSTSIPSSAPKAEGANE
ncbi:MAG: hypothetical protein LT106_15695 [Burkholderiaceae bacterium]|nr:hypothetical protein [Burkholderiaceae bacterium]